MGVKGFNVIVKLGNCVRKRNFKEYRNMILPLDTSHTIYKFCIAIVNTDNFKNNSGEIVGHLFACFFKTCAMLRYGIKPTWIMDGKPPDLKNNTIVERKLQKEKAHIKLRNAKSNDEKKKLEKRVFSLNMKRIDEIKQLLTMLGIQYIIAPEEAEAQCAALNIAGVTDAVVTEDWDALLFGCKTMLKNFSNKSLVTEIDGELLLKNLNMNREQLIDLGLILGTDYCHGIIGIKPEEAYTKFRHVNYNMENFIKLLGNENKVMGFDKYKIPTNFIKNSISAKEYFLNAPVADPSKISVEWKQPDFKRLEQYLIYEKGLNKPIIMKKIEELKLMYEAYINNYDKITGKNKLVTYSKILYDIECCNYENNKKTVRSFS